MKQTTKEEQREKYVGKAIDKFMSEIDKTTDAISKHGKDPNGIELDDYIMIILESVFLMYFHEKELPLELPFAVFAQHPEYADRLSNIISGQILDSLVKKGKLVEVENEEEDEPSYMLKKAYDKLIGVAA